MIVVRHFSDEETWLRAILDDFSKTLETAISQGRGPVFCLAGGTTPEPAYRAMARILANAAPTFSEPAILVAGDERSRPRTPADLNETMLRRAFSPALDAGAALLAGWQPLTSQAAALERMAAFFERLRARRGAPLFDACYLGLGADGHTAGLFPGSPALTAEGVTAPCAAPVEPSDRVTLTLRALQSARTTRYLVRSSGKEAALGRLQNGDPTCVAVAAAVSDALAFVLD